MAQITLGNLERNPKLLNQFIEENTRSMIQYCVRNFRNINEEDAEDLVQNSLLKLIEIVTQGEVQNTDAPAIAWMKKVLRWRCLDFLHSNEGKVISGEEGENIIKILPDPTSPEDIASQRERHQFLRECIEKRMKGRRHEIFELYLEGYIAAEIAQKLGVTRAFVSKETKIGCQNLRRWLKERGFD